MVCVVSRVPHFPALTNQYSAYNILMDFVFAIYPWLIMWKLDMKKSEKLGLCIVMSLVRIPIRLPLFPHTHRAHANTHNNRAWSSPSPQRSAPTGNTKATPKTNCTSGASACRPSGTRPKSPAPSSCNASPCCGRWSATSGRRSGRRCLRRCRRRGGWRLRMTLRWRGWSSSGIMRSRGFRLFVPVVREEGVLGRTGVQKLDGWIEGSFFWDTNYVRLY
jgi:hypothetical protein